MKRNKKVAWLAVLLVMMLAFAACGGKDADDVSGKITPANVEDKKDVTPTKAAENEATPTEAPEGDPTPTEAVEENKETTTEDDKTTSLGRVQGGVYVNEYMGISCELDSNWEFYTAEELQEIPNNVEELFAGTDAEETMSNLTSITDMSAENETDLTTMNILYQKMSFQERLAYQSLSNDGIIKMMATDQKDMMIQMYAQAGINVHEMYEKTVTFCGEERLALYMACDIAGVAYYGLQVVDYTLGEYAVTLTATSYVEDKTEEVLALFEKYE